MSPEAKKSGAVDPAKALKPIDEVRGALQKMESQFKMALPPQIPVEKFIRVVMTAVQNEPKLLQVDRQSFYNACMRCAQDGLIPDRKEAALTIFGNEAIYMPMVGGILKKVRNSGELASINAQVVYEEDAFEYWLDEVGEHIKHTPKLDGERKKRKLVYALARTKDGAVYFEVMTPAQVEAVKNCSRAKDKGPWGGPFVDEMWRKSAIRRLSKRLPMSTDLEQVIRRDDDLYDFDQGKAADPTRVDPTRPGKLATVIDASTTPVPTAAPTPAAVQQTFPGSEEAPI